MIKDNWLSNAKFTTVQTQVDLSAVRETRGDFNLADLSLAVNTPQTNDITVKAWLEKASTTYKGHQSMDRTQANALYRESQVHTGILCRYSSRDRIGKQIPRTWN